MTKIVYVAGIGERYRNLRIKKFLDNSLLCAETELTHLVDWSESFNRHQLVEDFKNTKEFRDIFQVYFDFALQQETQHTEFSNPYLRALMRATVQLTISDLYLYFSDTKLRRILKEQFILDMDLHKPRIVIAHGVGSVIAFETLSDIHLGAPVLITVGSPLALGLVQAELRQVLRTNMLQIPPGVIHWYNLFDPLDVLSNDQIAGNYDGTFIQDNAIFNQARNAGDYYGPHCFAGYLKTRAVRIIVSKNWI